MPICSRPRTFRRPPLLDSEHSAQLLGTNLSYHTPAPRVKGFRLDFRESGDITKSARRSTTETFAIDRSNGRLRSRFTEPGSPGTGANRRTAHLEREKSVARSRARVRSRVMHFVHRLRLRKQMPTTRVLQARMTVVGTGPGLSTVPAAGQSVPQQGEALLRFTRKLGRRLYRVVGRGPGGPRKPLELLPSVVNLPRGDLRVVP